MSYYDEIEIEDFEYVESEQTYYYPCPCGDLFRITLLQIEHGIREAHCPSCSLVIRVVI